MLTELLSRLCCSSSLGPCWAYRPARCAAAPEVMPLDAVYAARSACMATL